MPNRTVERGALLLGLIVAGPGVAAPPVSDPGAVAVAESTLRAMGGAEAWERVRCLRWRFMGKRLHHWDRGTGDVRIEAGERLVVLNVHTRRGRAWNDGVEIGGEALEAALEEGYAWWVNDSYWLLMPYKLLDPGVRLADDGASTLPDGRAARKLTVTFGDEVGLTPRNRYEVWVADDTGLVVQWAYYRDADDSEPRFVGPWEGWLAFGEILLSTSRGRGYDWEIAVLERPPEGIFARP